MKRLDPIRRRTSTKRKPIPKLLKTRYIKNKSRVSAKQISTFTSTRYDQTISKKSFNFLYPIGKGGFGRVWRVQHKRTRQHFAMKEMLKLRVITKRSVHSVMNQRKLLGYLRHPFIVNMNYAFQDKQNLYLVTDLMKGGDLRYTLSRVKKFTQTESKFLIACLIQGLEYIHTNGVIHRDIKPQNLVLDQQGYLRITDFGIARVFTKDNAKDTSGTPGYMAPEVLMRLNHSFPVDHFALGVLGYEFMMGVRPYLGRNRNQIRDHIISKQARVKIEDKPQGWSIDAVDFINALLQRKPSNRLGKLGTRSLKSHSWFQGFDWEKLEKKEMKPPFVPGKEENFDSRVTQEFQDQLDFSVTVNQMSQLFDGYYYHQNETPPMFSIIFKSFS